MFNQPLQSCHLRKTCPLSVEMTIRLKKEKALNPAIASTIVLSIQFLRVLKVNDVHQLLKASVPSKAQNENHAMNSEETLHILNC